MLAAAFVYCVDSSSVNSIKCKNKAKAMCKGFCAQQKKLIRNEIKWNSIQG